MARPVQADAQATRARILAAACHHFAEVGAGHARMREIARAASVSQACVHHYFGSKAALYRACVDATYAEVESLRQELWPQPGEPLGLASLLENGVRRAFRFACSHQDSIRLNMRTILDTGELDAAWREKVLQPFLGGVGELLESFSRLPRGRVRLGLHSLQALMIRYALVEPAELAVVVGVPGDPEQQRQAVEDHLVAIARPLLGLDF